MGLRLDEIAGGMTGVLFKQTVNGLVTNTVAETSIIGAGDGSRLLQPSMMLPGKYVRAEARGTYSTPGVVTSSVATKIKLGNTAIATGAATSLLVSADRTRFSGVAFLRFVSATSLYVDALLDYGNATSILNNSGELVTGLDLTQPLAFDLTGQWNDTSTTRIIKTTVFTLQLLN